MIKKTEKKKEESKFVLTVHLKNSEVDYPSTHDSFEDACSDARLTIKTGFTSRIKDITTFIPPHEIFKITIKKEEK